MERVKPAAGQESVWDYPRPPAYVPDKRPVEIWFGDLCIAKADHSIRVCETGSPPAFYLPPDAFDQSVLKASIARTFCEWKGHAHYFDVVGPQGVAEAAVWYYSNPSAEPAKIIAGWLSCYPEKLSCFVAGEPVRAQAGRYYGGWVTNEIVGPWKGEPGTEHW